MEFLNAMLARRSGRKYTGEPIREEDLRQILAAGLLTPSGKNLKPVQLVVTRDREQLEALSVSRAFGSAMLKGADAAVVVMADRDRTDTWVEDGSIAMTQMMLRAADLGIASCWIQGHNRMSPTEGVSTPDYVRKLFAIPENMGVVAILSLGMPAEQIAPHTLEEADFAKVHTGKF